MKKHKIHELGRVQIAQYQILRVVELASGQRRAEAMKFPRQVDERGAWIRLTPAQVRLYCRTFPAAVKNFFLTHGAITENDL